MRNAFKLKIGLALGGGAARGLAHLGVLRALRRAEIPIDVLVGTSMGAILGGAYAALQSVDELEQRVRRFLTSEEFRKTRVSFLKETRKERGGLLFSAANLVRRGILFGVSNVRPSFVSAENFAASMEALVPRARIESLPLTFGAVALDIEAAREIVIRHGDLRDAATASSAIPGVLPPVDFNGRLLVDGGWVDKVPVLAAFKLGADVAIGVDISAALHEARSYRRGVDIVVRANSIKDATLVAYTHRIADLMIEPAVKDIHWADFAAFERCVAAGEEATEAAVPEIRRIIRRERVLSLFRPARGKRLAELHLSSHPMLVEVA